MVAKFVRFAALARVASRGSPAVATPCNDNARGAVRARNPRRPVLIGRWFGTPSGALECRWSLDGDDPAQSRRRRPRAGPPRQSLALCSSGCIM